MFHGVGSLRLPFNFLRAMYACRDFDYAFTLCFMTFWFSKRDVIGCPTGSVRIKSDGFAKDLLPFNFLARDVSSQRPRSCIHLVFFHYSLIFDS